MLAEGRDRIGRLNERDLLIAGTALYAGEGAKTDGVVKFANTNPAMITLFLRWLRTVFDVDESRLRLRLYLHEGLDLAEAERYLSGLTGTPWPSSASPTGRSPTRPSGTRNTRWAARASSTPPAAPIGP